MPAEKTGKGGNRRTLEIAIGTDGENSEYPPAKNAGFPADSLPPAMNPSSLLPRPVDNCCFRRHPLTVAPQATFLLIPLVLYFPNSITINKSEATYRYCSAVCFGA